MNYKLTKSPYSISTAQPPGVSRSTMFPRYDVEIKNSDEIRYINTESNEVKNSVTYIAWGMWDAPYEVNIYENIEGKMADLVETIEKNDWNRMAYYAPKIKIGLNGICAMWEGIGVDLNFAIMEKCEDEFMYGCGEFNSNLYFPVLESTGGGHMAFCYAFNKPIEFPKLKNLQNTMFGFQNGSSYGEFMRDCYNFNQDLRFPELNDSLNYHLMFLSVFSKSIVFDKWVLQESDEENWYYPNRSSFDTFNNLTLPVITIELRQPQIIEQLPDDFCYGRGSNANTHEYVNLLIHRDSLHIVGNIWAGHTFRSIELI